MHIYKENAQLSTIIMSKNCLKKRLFLSLWAILRIKQLFHINKATIRSRLNTN